MELIMIHLMGKLKRYQFLVVLILSFVIPVIPVVPVTAFHKALEGINELTTTQCTDDHCVYLPMIISLVPEVDYPGCRWAYTPGNLLYIPYKWGDRLQTPGSSWRIAFETGLSTWNGTLTPIWYYHNISSDNIINTYNDELAGNRGITYVYCIVNGSTSRVEVYGNIYYDIRDVTAQAADAAGANRQGGQKGSPLIARRRASNTRRPFLRAVEM
jgi:hypothetical protein